MIQFLPFDTALFGYRVGKLQLHKSVARIESIQEQARNFDLIYVMGKPGLVRMGGWSPISTRVDWVKIIQKTDLETAPENQGDIQLYEQEASGTLSLKDQKQLRELVLTSGQWSRFNQDPLLANHEYEKLYTTWWETIKSQKHRVIVARRNGNLLGFVTFRLMRGRGYVDLFAVKGSEQGKGIGQKLMCRVWEELYALGYPQIGLSTQKANDRAMNFYKNAGFQPVKETLIAHWRPRLKDTPNLIN
ncbi:Acetyltransferase (GNAT) domain-containing protein [Cyclobacterium lianum]|uniref:Acetyltransferase (GNAT) domain-containing protein n=1 Tax=Cyclobacterium lianum TaxID=388280 RepID=A0A1M7QKY6_9BACT|nr:GNAT family N-acetyltransferase [Cyclobacterium lianum]SHN31856.1 Acetyltransferase (GNAT) domain-containing protein [Cyclobacterium lianum]